MTTTDAPPAPPFCPNPTCAFHRASTPLWRVQRYGFFARRAYPRRIQRYRCCHCRRHFSDQTFRLSYWLRHPQLLAPVFHQLLGCSGYRQIARHHGLSPNTVQTHAARLGRHCLLFHCRHRPPALSEPVVLDGFQSFEFSQYHPTWFHLLVGPSHFVYGLTDSELRRSGRMSLAQKRRRQVLEARFGRPHPRSIEHEVAQLLHLAAPSPQSVELHSDDHRDYPRAFRRLPHLAITHHVTPGRAARIPSNPLFPINLLDLLIRHSSANHKRETIAFSKRRQSAVERLWLLLVWRNYLKSCSERKRDGTPAMRLGLFSRALQPAELLRERLFPSRIEVPQRWRVYYRRETATRRVPQGATHRLRYAF